MVSIAAPTLNMEKSALACSRARRAAATSAPNLDSDNDLLHQVGKLGLNAPGGLEDVAVVQGTGLDTGGHVADARYPKDVHSGVPCGDGLRYGRHPNRVGTNRFEIP